MKNVDYNPDEGEYQEIPDCDEEEDMMAEYDLPDYQEEEEWYDGEGHDGHMTLNGLEESEEKEIETSEDDSISYVMAMLNKHGLNQESIKKRILEASDPAAEAENTFKEALRVISTEGSDISEPEIDQFTISYEDMMNKIERSMKLKQQISHVAEVGVDLVLGLPDIAIGTYQLLLKSSPTARKAGSWLAETFNAKETKKHGKGLLDRIEAARKEGKETRGRRS